jgi:hypothetical protein
VKLRRSIGSCGFRHAIIARSFCHLSINRGDNMMSVSLDVADVGSTG